MNTRLNGEDNFDPVTRGENTSRLETRLGSQMEGMHAEDNPDLVQTIKTAQEGAMREAEEVADARKEWLAARADGGVDRHEGEVDVRKIVPASQDNEIDALRKLRLAQMKGRAQERAQWIAKGHGAYARLEQESSFLEAMPKHERVVCALCEQGSMDGAMLHSHMRALAHVHVESFFCWLDPQSAPVMMKMVEVGDLPALLLAKNGQVVHQLHGLDRSFTTEGVAYELGQHGLVDFEEGTHYGSVGNACTTATAARAVERAPRPADDDDDDFDHDDDDSDDIDD
jgi:hypothetical protein